VAAVVNGTSVNYPVYPQAADGSFPATDSSGTTYAYQTTTFVPIYADSGTASCPNGSAVTLVGYLTPIP
jgi:hypothetical protein